MENQRILSATNQTKLPGCYEKTTDPFYFDIANTAPGAECFANYSGAND